MLPEVAADFFGLFQRLLRNSTPITKRLFFSSPYLEGILHTWALGIGQEHREALKTHQGFFAELLKTLREDLKQAGSIETME